MPFKYIISFFSLWEKMAQLNNLHEVAQPVKQQSKDFNSVIPTLENPSQRVFSTALHWGDIWKTFAVTVKKQTKPGDYLFGEEPPPPRQGERGGLEWGPPEQSALIFRVFLRQSNRRYLMSVIFLLREANIKLLDYHEWTETSLPLPWTPPPGSPSSGLNCMSSVLLPEAGAGGGCGLTASMLQSWHRTWGQQEPRLDPSGGARKVGLVRTSQKFHGLSSVRPHPHSPLPMAGDPRLGRWLQRTCCPSGHRALSASSLGTRRLAYCVPGKWIRIWGLSDVNIKKYISAQWIDRRFHCSSSIRIIGKFKRNVHSPRFHLPWLVSLSLPLRAYPQTHVRSCAFRVGHVTPSETSARISREERWPGLCLPAEDMAKGRQAESQDGLARGAEHGGSTSCLSARLAPEGG